MQSRYYNPEWGRFINADGLISTGQGFVGNNMFAYCNNNPTNSTDPSGYLPFVSGNQLGPDMMTYGGNEPCRLIIPDIVRRQQEEKRKRLDRNNTDEGVVLRAERFAYYNGIPVFRANLGRGGAFSYGIIVLDDDYTDDETGINVLKHEYGHILHMQDIGVVNYTFSAAAPSLFCAALANAGILKVDYYSLPWEYTADKYGGVTRQNYAPCNIAIIVIYYG